MADMKAPPKIKDPGMVIKRLLSYIKDYKFRFIAVLLCIVICAAASALSSMMIQILIDNYITPLLGTENPDFSGLLKMLMVMGAAFLIGALAGLAYNRMMVTISQGIQKKIRDEMFSHMQTLPISYFDTHSHGDVMSRYTNDIDTLRQMMSISLPQMVSSVITIVNTNI